MSLLPHWTLDDIDWSRFDAAKVSPDALAVVKTAAMIERNGTDYARYLCNVFHDDPEFCAVVRDWALEEQQHGLALGKWAALADASFDLDASFGRFTAMYQIPIHATESVRGSRAGELCARCIVETGTSSFYSAIRDAVQEPVLKQICGKIAADEFRHYKLFYTHMERYLARATASSLSNKLERLWVAISRFREADDDEIASAYHSGNNVAEPYDRAKAAAAYELRAFAFYQERHIRRAGVMFAQAAGFAPDGWVTRLLTRILWSIIRSRGRKPGPQVAAA